MLSEDGRETELVIAEDWIRILRDDTDVEDAENLAAKEEWNAEDAHV